MFKRFRARFIGKCSPVHFFWGAPDLAVTRFSGRPAPEHPGGVPNLPDRVAREAYSHEVSSCGFWAGGGPLPHAAFYAYAYPEPSGFASAAVKPEGAYYSNDLKEFILPYDVVRHVPRSRRGAAAVPAVDVRGGRGPGGLGPASAGAAGMILSEVTAILSRTPATLRALLDGLPDPWVEANEGPDTFSPRDVLGHLIYGEKTDWVPRIRLILEAGDRRPFEPFDRFAFRATIAATPTTALLAELEWLRAENLAFLEGLSLTPAQLALKGAHPALGPVTLGQLLATWAVHDLNHVGQIVRVMSKRYGEAVGPWKAYLGILNR